jgi:hypothetical protein
MHYYKSACLSFNERIFLILFSGDVQKISLILAEEVECILKQVHPKLCSKNLVSKNDLM